MNVWVAVGAIVAVFTLSGSILFHLFKTTWWMATLTASLDSLKRSVDKIEEKTVRYEATVYTQSDAARDFAVRDKEIDAAHRRLDEMKRGDL